MNCKVVFGDRPINLGFFIDFLTPAVREKQLLFTHVIALAEKEGKPVHLLVVPSSNILDAIALTAAQLDSAEVIAGSSPVLPPEGQAERFRKAWEKLRDKPKHQVRFHIIEPDGSMQDFPIG